MRRWWLCRACSRRLVTPELLLAALTKRDRMHWRNEILCALGSIAAGVHSNLEHRCLSDVERAHRLPTAIRQARMVIDSRSRYLDNLYEEFGVALELDGRAAQRTEDRWRDIHRDILSALPGLTTLRYS